MPGVPRELIWFVSRLPAGHRREIGTRKGIRRLGCYKQAVFALAWFRDKGEFRGWAAGSGCRSPPLGGVPGRSRHRVADSPSA
jgi:hypothetical protein